jgi:predicted ATPase
VITSLHLKHFKNFQDATLRLGSFTVLIGANAAGKSNIRDAFLFLHGIGRGYSLAEILGEKYVGGERVWGGIRGGIREVTYWGLNGFGLTARLDITSQSLKPPGPHKLDYCIEVFVGAPSKKPPPKEPARIDKESLNYANRFGFQIKERVDKNNVKVVFQREKGIRGQYPPARTYISGTPIVYQVSEDGEGKSQVARAFSRAVIQNLESFRFLDLSPTQMRTPSLPGLTTLGDRGENLSSVMAAICEDSSKKETLLEWVRKLTPMEVDDLLFDQDAAGRILLRLKEKNGRNISALSASDGTLRFIGILAALFGPTPASFYFIEELENGIHPTRLSLLVNLIESQTKRRDIQVVATSHSPQLLQFLSTESLEHAALVYRLPDHPDAQIKRIVEIPDARRVIKEQPVSVLHASSWFEDVLDFAEDEEAKPVADGQPAL